MNEGEEEEGGGGGRNRGEAAVAAVCLRAPLGLKVFRRNIAYLYRSQGAGFGLNPLQQAHGFEVNPACPLG